MICSLKPCQPYHTGPFTLWLTVYNCVCSGYNRFRSSNYTVVFLSLQCFDVWIIPMQNGLFLWCNWISVLKKNVQSSMTQENTLPSQEQLMGRLSGRQPYRRKKENKKLWKILLTWMKVSVLLSYLISLVIFLSLHLSASEYFDYIKYSAFTEQLPQIRKLFQISLNLIIVSCIIMRTHLQTILHWNRLFLVDFSLTKFYSGDTLFAEDKDAFEERWHSPRAGNPLHMVPKQDDDQHNPGDTSIFRRLFSGLTFPGYRKD